MVSLPSTTAIERRLRPASDAVVPATATVFVAGLGNSAAGDYAAHVRERSPRTQVRLLERDRKASLPPPTAVNRCRAALIVFLPARPTDGTRLGVNEALSHAADAKVDFVAIVSSHRAHFGDAAVRQVEDAALEQARALGASAVLFRTAPLLSPGSLAVARLRRFGFLYPLIPARLRGCCLEGSELFSAVETERQRPPRRRPAPLTLLGRNRPWRDLLQEYRRAGPVSAGLTAVSFLLSLLLIGQLAALVLHLLMRRWPSLARWNYDTLRPASLSELLTLYNPYNFRHVKIVGYNNGVVHFGHRYPGRTVVSTVFCRRIARGPDGTIRVDCGATIRQAMDFLSPDGRELYVIPNYSYVCLGTAFFVPIHGSAVDFTTIAETITRAALYDPVADRLIIENQDGPTFRRHVYDMTSPVLLLRLALRVRPKARYFVRREQWRSAAAGSILDVLRDRSAANAEVRKASAAANTVVVSRYYGEAGGTPRPLLELPRDSLGRLWDRLEENALTSFLMHALTRHFAWHVELFFTTEQFRRFWDTHRALPLKKIQVRYVRRDGLPNSPFRDHDCVSVDLFMLRRHRSRFEAYLRKNFVAVRTNPGKHSR